MTRFAVILSVFIFMAVVSCDRSTSVLAGDVPPFSIAVDIDDDGAIDAVDAKLLADGAPEIMRWYEPIFGADGKTPEPHFAREDYAQKITIDLSDAAHGAVFSVETNLPERIHIFADAACTEHAKGEWPCGNIEDGQLAIYLLAIPEGDDPMGTQKARLTVRYFHDPTTKNPYQSVLNLRVTGTKMPNPDYFSAARDALAEASLCGQRVPVLGDLIFRDSSEPFHVAVLRSADVRLQVFDATGLASDPVNAWRPNPGVSARNISEAVAAMPNAVAIINGNYFHAIPAVPGTTIGMYPEGPLLEAGKEWTSDPKKWGGWWVKNHGVFAQCDDGSFWYEDGAKGWHANARSGISALKVINWDAAPHALIGVVKVPRCQNEEVDELIVLLCSEDAPRSHTKITNRYNKDLGTLKRSLGLEFLGALDGGGSNALAYQTSDGTLRVIPGSFTKFGRHRTGSHQCINSYLVFRAREDASAPAPAPGEE